MDRYQANAYCEQCPWRIDGWLPQVMRGMKEHLRKKWRHTMIMTHDGECAFDHDHEAEAELD